MHLYVTAKNSERCLRACFTRSKITSAMCGSFPMLAEYQTRLPCFSVGLRQVG